MMQDRRYELPLEDQLSRVKPVEREKTPVTVVIWSHYLTGDPERSPLKEMMAKNGDTYNLYGCHVLDTPRHKVTVLTEHDELPDMPELVIATADISSYTYQLARRGIIAARFGNYCLPNADRNGFALDIPPDSASVARFITDDRVLESLLARDGDLAWGAVKDVSDRCPKPIIITPLLTSILESV